MQRLRAVLALSLLALAWGCGGSRSEPVRVESEGVEIAVSAEPAAPRTGENSLWIELRERGGAPLAGVEPRVDVSMVAMGTMPAMGGPARVTEVGGGRYRADFELAMGGTWRLVVAVGPRARAEGSLSIGVPGVRLAGSAPAAEAAQEAGAHHPAEFRLPPGRLQRIGVRTAPAERKTWSTSVRALGRVVAEEGTLEDVALKVRGWVGRIYADAVGDRVEPGEVLFTVYSPELYAAQAEYLLALRSQERARETEAPERAHYLVESARRRLRLWDLAPVDLERLERTRQPLEHLPIRAPVGGYVVEKNLVEGSAFESGQRLYRIAPLARVWIEAEVYEYELPLVREGQAASVTLPYLLGRRFEAKVAYVYPTLDPATRTARLRLEVPNPDLALRPDMYANVRVHAERGERLVVPQSAVLYAGERSFVFRALGDGRFRPQAVEVGLRSGEEVEILEGLEAGDEIVTSGTFLIASESRLRAALEQW